MLVSMPTELYPWNIPEWSKTVEYLYRQYNFLYSKNLYTWRSDIPYKSLQAFQVQEYNFLPRLLEITPSKTWVTKNMIISSMSWSACNLLGRSLHRNWTKDAGNSMKCLPAVPLVESTPTIVSLREIAMPSYWRARNPTSLKSDSISQQSNSERNLHSCSAASESWVLAHVLNEGSSCAQLRLYIQPMHCISPGSTRLSEEKRMPGAQSKMYIPIWERAFGTLVNGKYIYVGQT